MNLNFLKIVLEENNFKKKKANGGIPTKAPELQVEKRDLTIRCC